MGPDELKALLNSMEAAAEVVEAIDDPNLQGRREWNLTRWTYVLVPWGVRLAHSAFAEEIDLRIEVFQHAVAKVEKLKLDCEACSSQGGSQRPQEHEKLRRSRVLCDG